MDEKKKFEMWRQNCGYITEDAKGLFWECWQAAQDAVTRSAGDGEYSGLSWSGHNIRGDRDSVEAVKSAIHQAGTVPELKDEIAALLKRIAGDGREPVRARSDGFRDCITAIKGAIAFGQQDTNPPPEGHWLAEFWEIGNKRIAGEGREAVALTDAIHLTNDKNIQSIVPCPRTKDSEELLLEVPRCNDVVGAARCRLVHETDHEQPAKSDDMVLVRRDVIAAACHAISKQKAAPKVLNCLRAAAMDVAAPPESRQMVASDWKLAPVESTKEMWDAVNKLDDQMAAGSYDGKGCTIEQAWNCMIDAAPIAEPVAWLQTEKNGAKPLVFLHKTGWAPAVVEGSQYELRPLGFITTSPAALTDEPIGYADKQAMRNFDKGLSDELSVYRREDSCDAPAAVYAASPDSLTDERISAIYYKTVQAQRKPDAGPFHIAYARAILAAPPESRQGVASVEPVASPAALTDEQRVSAAKAMATVFLGFELEREPGNLELRAVDAVIRSLAAPPPSGT